MKLASTFECAANSFELLLALPVVVAGVNPRADAA